MAGIIEKTEEKLKSRREQWEPRFRDYFDKIAQNQQLFKELRARFRMRGWLRAYLNVTEAKSPNPKFSIRYGGQEVGEIQFQGKEPYLVINKTKKHFENNEKYFNFHLDAGKYKWWGSDGAKEFRKRFEDIQPRNVHVEEHRIETLFLDELQNPSSDKFCGTFKGIQPVQLGNKISFGMPVPIKARGGAPCLLSGKQLGHIDILARYGIGRSKLTVIELKREGGDDKGAAAQSIIYASALSYMLRKTREEFKEHLWRLCGYRRDLPLNPKLNAVLAMPESGFKKYQKNCDALKDEIKGSDISLHYLVYRSVRNRIKIIEKSI